MTESEHNSNFITDIIDKHNDAGRFDKRVHTRFPPEPNGHLHIGHVKAICINFATAARYGGKTNLRFDDTNPVKEDTAYVEGIMRDIEWLGFEWDNLLYASDYFGQLYAWAETLISEGKAYVDDLSADEMRAYRGTLTEPGKNSPYRDRSVEENLDLFRRMKAGEFPDGSRVLRAKIDMGSPNFSLRDPAMYRILHAHHHRTGDEWCIYPMYDWAHGQSDSIERVTHSLCSLEFENNRPLYDWFTKNLDIYAPQQIEFARLTLSHTITSKRKLIKLVEEGYVDGWDDPRMPTISGMRRRGYTPTSLRYFIDMTGTARSANLVEMAMLEHAVRDDLNKKSARAMVVLDPLKIVVTNYPEDQVEWFDVKNFPQDKSLAENTRKVPFSRELYIEREDFSDDPPGKYKRLALGREIRFIGSYFLTANRFVKDESGKIIEVQCTYAPDSRGGNTPDKRKVKGTIHWVSATHAVDAEVRLYDTLFTEAIPTNAPEGEDFTVNINPDSLDILTGCKAEPMLANATVDDPFQFMRTGYFILDAKYGSKDNLVFNRTVSLRDTWKK